MVLIQPVSETDYGVSGKMQVLNRLARPLKDISHVERYELRGGQHNRALCSGRPASILFFGSSVITDRMEEVTMLVNSQEPGKARGYRLLITHVAGPSRRPPKG